MFAVARCAPREALELVKVLFAAEPLLAIQKGRDGQHLFAATTVTLVWLHGMFSQMRDPLNS
jgi:hypothetical protein